MADTNTSSASDNPDRPRLSLRLNKDNAGASRQPVEKQDTESPAKNPDKIGKPRLPLKKTDSVQVEPTSSPGLEAPHVTAAEVPPQQLDAEQPVNAEQPADELPAPKLPAPPPVESKMDQPEATVEKAAVPTPPRRIEAPPPPRRPKPPEPKEPISTAGKAHDPRSHFLQAALLAIVLICCAVGAVYLVIRLLSDHSPQDNGIVDRNPAVETVRPTGGPAGVFDKVNAVTDKAAANTQVVNEVITTNTQAPQPAMPTTSSASPTPPSPEPTGSQRTQSRVDSYPVSLVMPNSSGGRIVIDNVVYRAGDLVEPSLGLRFKTVDASSKRLVFQDESGAQYYKSY